MIRRVTYILRNVFIILFALLISIWVLLHFSPVQTWLVRKASHILSDQLQAEVSVKRVDFSIFKSIIIEGVLIKDKQKDTLFYTGRIAASFNNWFILKNQTVIKKISLEHTRAYLHRKDSVWNYKFIEDAFSSPQKDKKSSNPIIRLENINLQDLIIIKKDEWLGEDISISVQQLDLDPKLIQLDKSILNIDKINIIRPYVVIYNYAGKKPRKKKIPESIYHLNLDTTRTPLLAGWDLKANQINIYEGEFQNLMKKTLPAKYFDSEHILFRNITATLSNLKVQNDSLLAQLSLRTKERSGLDIRKLNANIIWHSRAMEFHSLYLQTPQSILTDFFAMRYIHFIHDMNHFEDHVTLEGNFNNSIIHSNDIAFFAPLLNKFNEHTRLSGYVSGNLQTLKGNKVRLNIGNKTSYKGQFILNNLLKYDNFSFYLNESEITTHYKDLIKYISSLKSIKTPNLSLLGNIGFKGNLSGNADLISVNGSIYSELGKITSKLDFYLPNKGIPSYKGKINTVSFQFGRFLNINQLGEVSMDAEIEGKGFALKDLNINIKDYVHSIEILGYKYKNLQIQSLIDNHSVRTNLKIADNNLSLDASGNIQWLKNDTLLVQMKGAISKICFRELGLSDKEINYQGFIDADFKLKHLDDFYGYISLNKSVLGENEKQYNFNNFLIEGKRLSDQKNALYVQSDMIEANIEGIYKLKGIRNIGLKLLSVYFPTYFKSTYNINEIQDFVFDIKTREIDSLLSIFDLPIKGGNQSVLSGIVNTNNNIYQLKGTIPQISTSNINFENIYIESNNDISGMKFHAKIDAISLSDSLKIPNTNIDINASNDKGSITINTSVSESLKNADLKTRFQVYRDGINFEFLKSGFILNDKAWNIENDSEIFIGKNNLFSEGIILTSGNEEVKIFTHPSDLGTHNDVTVELRKVELGELLPYFIKDPRIEGTTTGRLDILDPLGNLEIEGKITTEKLRINNDSIGIVPLETKYIHKTKVLTYKLLSDNIGHVFNLKGNVNFKNTDSIHTDNIFDINNESLSIIEPYLTGILSDIKGTGTGILRISGDVNNLQLTGNLRLNQASFVIDYTKCRYNIMPGGNIEFSEDLIDFGNMLIKDSAGRIASFNGEIKHSFFNKVIFDLHFESMNKNKGFLVLNTTAKDNSLFYGKVVAYANGTIAGPANNLTIKLRGQPTDSSRIYLPTSDSRVTGTASFIVFRQYGTDLRAITSVKENSNINIDLDILANPYAKVFLILDEVTNDIIEGQGNGAINLRVGTNQKTTITGNYEITKGKYNFNWQSLFKKPFLINKGTINWSGDPYDARINIDANYLVEQVKLPEELANGCTNDRNNILVVANLSNTLKNPSIKFRFELPQGHPCRNNPLTNNGLAQLYNNPDELNRQVVSLLLIGSFITNTPNQTTAGSGLGNTFFSSAAGTLSEFIAQQVTTGLDAVLRNIPGLRDLRLDPYVTFTPGLITSTQAEGIGFQGTGSFGFTRRLLNGRVLVKAGGSMLVATGQNNTVQNNRQLTPDISLEWLITPDGKLRLIGFYRTVFDIQRRNDRTGVSFSYIKEFDKIW